MPWASWFLFALGLAAGIAFVLLPWFGLDAESTAFIETASTQLWIALIGLQVAVSAMVFPTMLRAHADLSSGDAAWNRRIGISAVVFLVLYVVPIAVPILLDLLPATPLPLYRLKVAVLTLAAGVVVLLGVTGIFRIQEAAVQEFEGEEVTDHSIGRFLLLRARLQRFRGILAAMIGLAVLAAGALRNAALTLPSADPAKSPPEAVWAYGAYLTLILALVYVPAHRSLTAAGQRMRDRLCPLPERPTADSLSTYQQRRKAIGDVLQLDITPWESLGTGVTILAPLVAAFVSVTS